MPLRDVIQTWQDAEILACETMKRFGFSDARLSASGVDAGIDVEGTRGVAQVKHQTQPVGRPAVQQLVGAAHGREPFFFSAHGYTNAAVSFADRSGVALFTYESNGQLAAVNEFARLIEASSSPIEPLSPSERDLADRLRKAERTRDAIVAELERLSKLQHPSWRDRRKLRRVQPVLGEIAKRWERIGEASRKHWGATTRIEWHLRPLKGAQRKARRILSLPDAG